jgi:hypothetical protein
MDAKYPDLTASYMETSIFIRGTFPVQHEGKTLDRYQIEVEWSDDGSKTPALRETGGRIPWVADRHMSIGGYACLFVPEDWLIQPQQERTVLSYLDGPVRNYFLWQSLFEQGKSPPWYDRPHGLPGLIEAYGNMVGFREESSIRRCLEYLSRHDFKGHWKCPCGSGMRIRECNHLEQMRKVKGKVPRHIAKLALRRLQKPVIR